MITGSTKVYDVVKQYIQAVGYLQYAGVDILCPEETTLEEAAAAGGANLDEVLAMLHRFEESVPFKVEDETAEIERFKALSFEEKIWDLEMTHHAKDRRLMRAIEPLLARVMILQYPEHQKELRTLHNRFAWFMAGNIEHYVKEERVVFPIMIQAAKEGKTKDLAVVNLVRDIAAEHSNTEMLRNEMLEATNNLTAPEDAGPDWKRVYELLWEMFADQEIHMDKEERILFPEFYAMGEE